MYRDEVSSWSHLGDVSHDLANVNGAVCWGWVWNNI